MAVVHLNEKIHSEKVLLFFFFPLGIFKIMDPRAGGIMTREEWNDGEARIGKSGR